MNYLNYHLHRALDTDAAEFCTARAWSLALSAICAFVAHFSLLSDPKPHDVVAIN